MSPQPLWAPYGVTGGLIGRPTQPGGSLCAAIARRDPMGLPPTFAPPSIFHGGGLGAEQGQDCSALPIWVCHALLPPPPLIGLTPYGFPIALPPIL